MVISDSLPHFGHVTVSFLGLDIICPSLQCEASVVFAVDGECEQRTLVHCCEVAGALIFVAVVLLDQLQRFAQLQHGRKFVLAVVAAEAG